MSAFFEAIKKGDQAGVERELRADPSLARAEEDGTSAVLLATYHGRHDIATLLAERKGDLTIFEAAAVGDVAQVRAHVEREPTLVNAYAELLLEKGADPLAMNDEGMTAAGYARSKGHEELARAIEARVRH